MARAYTTKVDGETSDGGRGRDSIMTSKQMKAGIRKSKSMANVKKVKRTYLPVKEHCCRAFSKVVVDHKSFMAFTTVFTFYALIGDDVKLIATDKPADVVFNVITGFAMVLFTFEIVISCIGKRDYFLGFFFTLDVISTSTLVLDISYVADAVWGADSEDLDMLRSGRTARIGARAGRVVRVIRLVRILKLYKALHEAQMQAKLDRKTMAGDPRNFDAENEEDWGDEDERDEKRKQKMQAVQESRVGKKLSEMTTRRVIMMVLTMLLVMPFLQTDASNHPPGAAYFGADNVLESYREMNTTATEVNRKRYEHSVLKYMYYHNWFSGNFPDKYNNKDLDAGPPTFASHAFWVGIMSLKNSNQDFIENSAAWANVELRQTTVESYDEDVKSDNIYPYGRMPGYAKTWLSGPWIKECGEADKGIWRRGLSIIQSKNDEVQYAVKCPKDLRNFEKMKYYARRSSVDQYEDWHFAFYFDMRPFQRQEATYSLLITGFICIVLCAASLSFSALANRLVLRPVEKMIKRVEIIREDPLVAVHMADEEFKLEEKEKAKLKAQKSHLRAWNQARDTINYVINCGIKEKIEPMETVILEKTIIKLGSLLALGFGEAGSNIINHNLQASDSAGVNGMVPGSRVEAIIGVARVRDFSTATEVLNNKVMTFVNQIAEIVHGVVSEFHGAANKNNGDTFLLVWQITGLEDWLACRMADFSTIAFAKILGAIHVSPTLSAYRAHPGMQQRLGSDYRVCLSFGLHAGWAIEGAVGSEFKIDASYLSPNVSIAVSVEDATRIYGVDILMTECVVDMCQLVMASRFRKIDRVIITGSSDPLDLYCLDLDYSNLEVDNEIHKTRPHHWNHRLRFKARQFLEFEKEMKLDYDLETVELFESDKVVCDMRERYTMEFTQVFNMGYSNYFEGEWEVARKFFNETQNMLGACSPDGPSNALLKYMEFGRTEGDKEPYKFVAPKGWKGVHDLNHHGRPGDDAEAAGEDPLDSWSFSKRKDPSMKLNAGGAQQPGLGTSASGQLAAFRPPEASRVQSGNP
jgi:class 3 adenylate cyclase